MVKQNFSEHEQAVELLSQILAGKSLTVEEAMYQFKLGIEALHKPELPRLVFADGATLEAQITALESQLSKLRMQQIYHLFCCGISVMTEEVAGFLEIEVKDLIGLRLAAEKRFSEISSQE